MFVFNKIDLTEKEPKIDFTKPPKIYLSAKTGEGMHLIKQIIKESFESNNTTENVFLARTRHIEHLKDGQAHLTKCNRLISEGSLDLVAEELRLSHLEISAILGQNPTEDLLTKIFTSFCIGK